MIELDSVFSRPVRWARLAAGTRLRFVYSCGISIGIGLASVYSTLLISEFIEIRDALPFHTFALDRIFAASTCFFILVGSVFLPITYLVALRELLRELDRQASVSNTEESAEINDIENKQ